MRKGLWTSIAAAVASIGFVSASFAALLGVLPGFPNLTYDANGVVTYNAGSQSFKINASPIAIRFSPVSPPRLVTPTGVPPTEVLSVDIIVDGGGTLLSGVAGDDLVLVGQVDENGDSTPDYTGVLLTGEIIAFGHEDSGGPTDQYDFRFAVTGGALAGHFAGKDIGLTTVSENSTFGGSFQVNFGGGAKGALGPIDKVNRPPVCNANGPYVAECGGASTTIVLDGTQSSDDDGNELTYAWTTNCPNASIDNPTSDSPVLTIQTAGVCNLQCEVTLTVSDGIAPPQECVATVTIQDTNAPVVSCPSDTTIECSASTDPSNTGSATANDDCDPNATVTYSDVETPGECAQAKTITRTWTASDTCGNTATCVQTITIVDTTLPQITQCPTNNIEVTCAQGTEPDVTGRPVVQDDCDPAPVVTYNDVEDNGCCPIASIIRRTWTVTDACGNSTTCLQTIKVRDTQRPEITCPPDKTIQCTESKHPSNTGYATAVDACDSNPTVTYYDDTCGTCPKVIRRTWKARDDCGNRATCVQTITIVDTVPPTFTCPPDKTIFCGDSTDPCRTGRPTNVADNCDNCPNVSYTDARQGTCPGTITRTWTAKDRCNNRSTCTQVITIVTQGPCPRTPGYWKNHRSAWPVNSLQVGAVTYNATQLMNLLSNKLPNGQNAGSDRSASLAKFVIATKFNLLDGSPPAGIQTYVDQADAFLSQYPPGSNPRGSARQTATTLQDELDEYCNSRPSGCRSDC